MMLAMSRAEHYLTQDEQRRVKALIDASSNTAVAKKLSVSANTLRAVAGGLSAQRGTILLVRTKLAEAEREASSSDR